MNARSDCSDRRSHVEVARAQRFPICAAMRYRERGEALWSEGTTVNISRSGILFRSERLMRAKTMLEMMILFPTEVTGGIPADLVCWGPVVRSEASGGGPCLAAAILHYHFKHSAPQPAAP